MKTLIVEDDFVSRMLLQELVKKYGDAHIAVNGQEAVDVYRKALKEKTRYDLICLDIMMPEKDGQAALKELRAIEEAENVSYKSRARIIMTTALGDVKNVMGAFFELCDGYLVKPFSRVQLEAELKRLKLI